MRSLTPGRPRLSLILGIVFIVVGVLCIPLAISQAHHEYGIHFWWLVIAPLAGGLYFAIAGAIALSRQR
ncbi:hypothetical protein GCM10010988_26870 [Cnuibacter physcomitrellae]|uniref:hypothetical protein n=1 Tax=Cnuibacter physcomitrellae TaxID=1619308 RepID=UPI0013B44DEC|nr:hypothetical protein [Cnuibacter physcomitrellae]MCS5497297.1 hypothetical protein [Cnuibacter physcomitrellae]GGI39995.1 hypothetical protein GCM10010988_26870 [Cnuibacter physcomitrellae]